ncbi:uncharacterized protein LOC121737637 [Aricia agestis]|uniref:uncharacterized protein LOC121737637 n=1 Tax=Aricia agestis TaxID=91739 RepID=UPI001C203576|nr:uncharacterized protein LOC121737637 [Aricia agestis]
MAVTRRGYIFCSFVSSVFCVIFIIVSVSSDSWVVATAFTEDQTQDSTVRYGMFKGEFALHIFDTPSYNTLYMTCVPDKNACAVSCKTEASAREEEVRALAQGFRPNQACVSVTNVSEDDPLEHPPVLSFAIYISILLIQFLQLAAGIGAGALALLNATRNPTEPVFGLPGCLWANVLAAVLGVAVMMMFGVYWVVSGLREHLAFSYIALGTLEARPGVGFSYWVLLGSIICSISNVVLIQVRQYLLERDPPPPTLKVENHSDGTIFLY